MGSAFFQQFGRKASLTALVAGVFGMMGNHWEHTQNQKYYLLLGALAPICVVVGLLGVMDPRWYIAGVMKQDGTVNVRVPSWCLVVGITAWIVGVGLAIYLNRTVYSAYW